MSEKMTFYEGGVTQQIPSLAAVRIVLARVTGDRSLAESVGSEYVAEFDFCLANSIHFCCNAMKCANAVLSGVPRRWREGKAFDDFIAGTLKDMCLACVRERSADGDLTSYTWLREQLKQLNPWDRHRAADMLTKALEEARKPRVVDFSHDS